MSLVEGTRHAHEFQQNIKQAVAGLRSNGAGVNTKNSGGNTPLHFAVSNEHVECAKILVSNGADANTKNSNDVSPLDCTTSDTAMYECLTGKTRKEILEEQILEQQLANLKQQQQDSVATNKLKEQGSSLLGIMWLIIFLIIIGLLFGFRGC